MINSSIDIIIPAKNCILELRRTLESLSKQIKSRGIKVIILDAESDDGTFQYIEQARVDYRGILDIHPVKNNDSFISLTQEELKKHIICLTPGTAFDSPDSLLDIFNKIGSFDFYVFKSKYYNPFTKILEKIGFINTKFIINCILLKRDLISELQFYQEDTTISLSSLISKKNYKIKIVRTNITEPKILQKIN